MTGNLTDFNASEATPTGSFDPLPDDTYVVIITEADRKINKANTGSYIALTMEVVSEGPYKTRRLWDYLNIEHSNETAQNIGRGKLSAICKAIKKEKVSDTSELMGAPFKVKVGIDKKDPTRNVIKEYVWRESKEPAKSDPNDKADWQ